MNQNLIFLLLNRSEEDRALHLDLYISVSLFMESHCQNSDEIDQNLLQNCPGASEFKFKSWIEEISTFPYRFEL